MSIVGRVVRELGRVRSADRKDRALAAHVARPEKAVAELVFEARTACRIDFGAGTSLDAFPGPCDVVWIAPGVYERVTGREARVALLRRASELSSDAVVLALRVGDEGSRLPRLLVDPPRRLLRSLSSDVPEAGDRFEGEGFVHRFYDEEPLLGEAIAAGLAITAQRGPWYVLRRARPGASCERADSFALELVRVVAIAKTVERARRETAPEQAVGLARALGARREARAPIGRARLRRAIGWVDAMMPGGANCYRRVLLELALDAAAARETLVFGLDVGRTGHVAFKDREDTPFDVAFEFTA